MRARRIAIFGAGGLVFCLGIAFWPSKPPLPQVRFPDGTSSRVLKISVGTNHVFSTEPLWKKTLRGVLPDTLEKPLGAAKRYDRTTAHDSLAIYMEPLAAPRDNRWTMLYVETTLPDGKVYAVKWMPSSPGPIVFENYARGEKHIPLRFSDIEIKLPNPRPVKRSSWIPRELPQTNDMGGNQVIVRRWQFVRGISDGELKLEGRCATGGPVGWMEWQTTLFDPWGNWSRLYRERRPPCPGGRDERLFRLLAEGTEYISAGFVEPPANEQFQILRPNPRMTNWGVQFVALFGPGRYEVSKDFEIKSTKRGFGQTNALSVIGSSWLIQCADVLTLSISEKPTWEVRVRERLPDKRGRVFAGAKSGMVPQNGMVGQLFRPRVPTITTNLEVEVIVRWPPAEFFIQKPE